MALPAASATPALDFEVLTSRGMHETAPSSRMVPRERWTMGRNEPDGKKKGSSSGGGTSGKESQVGVVGDSEDQVVETKTMESSTVANKLVRTLVATTPAYIRQLKAQHEAAVAEGEREKDDNWKTSHANRTRMLIEELTGSSPDTTPPLALGGNNGNSFDPRLHEVAMSDWESKIQWDGLKQMDISVNNNNNTNASGGGGTTSAAASAAAAPPQVSSITTTKPTDPLKLLRQRRNHWLDTLEFDNTTVNWEGVTANPHQLAMMKPIPLLLELGVAGQSVARHVFPSQRPAPGSSSAEYQQRMEREWQNDTGIISTADVAKSGSLHADREKMEALIEARQKKRAQMAKDKTNRVTEAMGTLAMGPGKGRTITSSLMGPGGTERTGRPSRHNVGTTSAHEMDFMEQLDMVSNHSLVRDLGKVALRQYHRPKLPRSLVRNTLEWQFQLRYMGRDIKPGAAGGRGGASYQSIMMGTHPGAISKAKLRSEADLSPSEGKLVLLEYCEERPPIQLTKGMATKFVNYYRGDKAHCPVSRGGGDRPTRKKKRSENESPSKAKASTKNSILGDRPPRLEGPDKALKASASDWIGKIPKKSRDGDAAAKNNTVDMLPEGVTEMLHPKVHGPFIGEIEEGMTISGLISLLFVAPLFRQEPEQSDFIMILGKPLGGGGAQRQQGSSEAMGVMLRDMPKSMFTVGQTEPRTRVFAPNTQGEKSFLGPFVSYQIAKLLARTQSQLGHGLRFDEIQNMVMPNLGLPGNNLRQRLKQVALYDKNTQIWTTKAIGYEDYLGVDALGKSIAPEGVAAFETAAASARRLMDLGVNQLFQGSHSVGSVGVTMIYVAGQMNAAKELHRKAKKMCEFHRNNKSMKPSQVMFFEKAAENLELQYKCLRQRHDCSKFIFEELQLTPWHLTGEFIEVHKKGEGTGMMKLTGLGDPSGVGEGFSFLREMDSKPSKSVGQGQLNNQIKKITGTEDDLRKLTMKQMAALLRSYGMAQKQIDTLKRWDRVHVIRDLSTKAASDGIGDGLERFARGEKMKLSEQKQVYRKRIQVIWKRQIASLSANAEGGGAAGGEAGDVGASAADADGEAAAGGAGATNKAAQKKQEKKEESDSDSDDDDFAAEFEDEMLDQSGAQQLVAAHARGGDSGDMDRETGLGKLRAAAQDQDLTKEARELAALKRQREEERAAKEGLGTGGKESDPAAEIMPTGPVANRKVVRKKIVKTFPDGRQTTTFKFITRPDEVGKVMAKLNEKSETEKPRKNWELATYEYGRDERAAGHALFEDDDDFDYQSRGRLATKARRGGRRGGRTAGSPTGARRGPKPRTALNIGKLKSKANKEQRIKKRKREEEEADLYTAVSKKKGTSNRRERGSIRDRRPHVIFSERLEGIRAMVEGRPSARPFDKPVNRRQIPRYYEVISNPIDLSTIREKINRYEYRTAEAFVKDFELMKNNAIKFNGSGTPIADEGVTIYEMVKEQVDANQTELKGMEEAVKEQLSGKPKKKKKKKVKGKKAKDAAAAAAVPVAAAAPDDGAIMGNVDVNIGDLPENFELDLDGIGSDSDGEGLVLDF